MLNLYNIKLRDGSENLFYLAYGMPQSRTSRTADFNPVVREANDTLDAFYDDKTDEPMGYTFRADMMLNALLDTTATDSLQSVQKVLNAIAANNAINSTNPLELNHKAMNTYFLSVYLRGLDTLTESDKTIIETLAKSCPFVEGNAVYKARLLWSSFEPWFDYNNMEICNNAAQNKNGKGLFDDDNEKLASMLQQSNQQQTGLEVLGQDAVKIYPNPSNGNITIQYSIGSKDMASLAIYDVLGRELQRIALQPYNTAVQARIAYSQPGVYIYKYSINGIETQTGKLILE